MFWNNNKKQIKALWKQMAELKVALQEPWIDEVKLELNKEMNERFALAKNIIAKGNITFGKSENAFQSIRYYLCAYKGDEILLEEIRLPTCCVYFRASINGCPIRNAQPLYSLVEGVYEAEKIKKSK